MKYLLDTGVWLWSISEPGKLNGNALKILGDGSNDIFVSAASAWEISIKARLGKLRLPLPPAESLPLFMKRQNLKPLAITHAHAIKVFDLPSHHNDPFDRLIIAQAMIENMPVLTADAAFRKYPVDVVWCAK